MDDRFSAKNLRARYESLAMTPADWAELNRRLDENEYRKMVLAYQKRERERMPKCGTLFGLCRYYDHGLCGNYMYCPCKKIA